MPDWFDYENHESRSKWEDLITDFVSRCFSSPSTNSTPLKRMAEEIYGRAQKIGDYVKQASCTNEVPTGYTALLLGIGYPQVSPETSITNKAYAFSDAVFGWPEDDRGSAKGSFRHILWQSDMTAKYGEDIARKVGECHERKQPFYPRDSFFASIDDADRTVDQLNNIIGRRVGNEFKYLSTKDRALRILQIGYTEGFYSVLKRGDGFYEIIRKPMGYEEYERKRKQILRLDDNGKAKE